MIYVHTPTYARTALLREAMESVRCQTYRGEIMFVIYNDCPWQTLDIDQEDWPGMNMHLHIVNERARHASLGAKRQAMLQAAPDDAWIAFLDDDDLWMPHYLAQSMTYCPDADVIISQTVFYHRHDLWTYEEIAGGIPMLVRADWAKRAGGFPLDCSYGEDNQFRQRLLALPGIRVVRNQRPGYVVRAGGGHLHASMASEAKFMLNAEAQRERGKEPEGVVTVRPAWDLAYDAMLRGRFPEAF